MYSLKSDYSEGAHPKVLKALAAITEEQNEPYGLDLHSRHAAELIREAIGRPEVQVHFLEGGTQTNLTAMAAFLRPYEAAVAAESGHIHVHETGAVEATGHKVVAVPGEEGKLTPKAVETALERYGNEHMVKPKLLYVSDSTELGTIYSREELTALHELCREKGLLLYLDGARLGAALTAKGNTLSLTDAAALTDAFYIGGTKNGALFGEALVICNPSLQQDFRYILKQRGAMLAKGAVLGAQFEALFQDRLYFQLADHANRMAERLRDAVRQSGFAFFSASPTNQIFPILPDSVVAMLRREYDFELWDRFDESHSVIRLVTSWATPEPEVQKFIGSLRAEGK